MIRIAAALDRLGIKKGDRAAILSENRPEWAYTDLAILSLGAVVVPVYPTASPKDMEYVLNHCEAQLLFASTVDQLARVKSIRAHVSSLRKVIVFDLKQKEADAVVPLLDFVSQVDSNDPKIRTRFEACVGQVSLDDLATIIYTSGTTGPPKGVMLSHRNFLVNCYDAREALPLNEADLSLSFLPLSHVFERMGGYYLGLLCGSTVAYAENMNTVPENLLETKPTIACAVPRFFEKLYARIRSEVDQGGALRKAIFQWALRVGSQSSQFRMRKKNLPFVLWFQYYAAQKLVYQKIYQKLGGRLRCFISGSAPLAKELAEFFYSVGILILEGYGLTETSPVISVNRMERFKFGSVGLPLRNVETKITSDGEIAVRGPSVMLGYYKNHAATGELIRDGWFHTGDLGYLDSEGFLFITGRKKDVIKTSGGKMISPQNIENLILTDPLFSQIVMVGDKHNFVTALVVPNFDQVRNVLKANGDESSQMPEDLVQDPRVHKLIREHMEERTRDLAQYEKIKFFTLLPREFSQDKGEVTITLKIKRSVVAERYRDAIERVYRETENKSDEGRDRIFFLL